MLHLSRARTFTRARRLVLASSVATLAAACESTPEAPPASATPETPACTVAPGNGAELPTPPIDTPRWAFEPWISKDISTGADSRDFVAGFRSRGIPVGALVLDSPWETQYQSFVPHPVRYPELGKLVSDMHADGVKVVLWIAPLVNDRSFDLEEGGDTYENPSREFEEGRTCGFFVDKGQSSAWWKGTGAAVDFFNPAARAWWHSLQDRVLTLGIDGWKCDFGESYLRRESVETAAGVIPFQRYSEEYYRDFWAYGVAKTGRKDFVTMVRAWDESYDFKGRFFARPEHSPVSWMGDNRQDFVGLADALDHMFRSARAGYVMLGSDIGGYLDKDDKNLLTSVPFSQEVFARWTAVGALSPFMQLHGRANLAPWTVPVRADETVALYRYWATLHHELVPFLFSAARHARAGGPNLMEPEGAEATWPGDYRYTLGRSFLVAPLLDATGRRDVALPAGARWYDWWRPEADALAGGETVKSYDATDQMRIPLFVRAGSIVPMEVDTDVTGLGSPASKGHLTVLVYPASESDAEQSFVLHEDGGTTRVGVTRRDRETAITLSRVARPTLLRVRADVVPTSVTLAAAPLPKSGLAALATAASGWAEEASTRSIWVKVPPSAAAIDVKLSGP